MVRFESNKCTLVSQWLKLTGMLVAYTYFIEENSQRSSAYLCDIHQYSEKDFCEKNVCHQCKCCQVIRLTMEKFRFRCVLHIILFIWRFLLNWKILKLLTPNLLISSSSMSWLNVGKTKNVAKNPKNRMRCLNVIVAMLKRLFVSGTIQYFDLDYVICHTPFIWIQNWLLYKIITHNYI